MFSISFKKLFNKTLVLNRSIVSYVNMDHIKENALKIFLKSVTAVDPQSLINNTMKLDKNELVICNKRFSVNKNCNVVGFGKAVFAMSLAIESILCGHLVRGIISIPVGTLSSQIARQAALNSSRLQFIEGAENNLPDTGSENAAKQIAELVRNLGEEDILIVLISGGGSALLPFPKPPVTLQEKSQLIKLLSSQSADIVELNCVRKRLSEVKGGGLSELAYPANGVALILSDIIGDPLDCIASGPTTPNSDAADAAMKIIEKYALSEQLPGSIRTILHSKADTEPKRICKAPDGNFIHMTNFVIGNNKLAAREACFEASRLGYHSRVISLAVSGDVSSISDAYARIAIEIAKVMKGLSSKDELRECLANLQSVLSMPEEVIGEVISLNLKSGAAVCLVGGGEPTVRVSGGGKGGRNQQLALQFAIDVNNATRYLNESVKRMNITLLSCGTDGIDGPTDAAGAIGFPQLCTRAILRAIDPLDYIARNDSYNFYRKFEDGRYLIKTGHTGTNVMDIHLLIIQDDLNSSFI